MTRPLALVIAFALAAPLLAQDKPDPKSNNKDAIVGKWKVTAPPDKDPGAAEGFKELGKLGIYMYMEFKKDGKFSLGFGADKPESLDLLKKSLPGGKVEFPAKYRLLEGDKVELYDLSAEAKQLMSEKGDTMKSDITIKKDEMVVKDPDGTVTKLARLKEEAKKDKQDK